MSAKIIEASTSQILRSHAGLRLHPPIARSGEYTWTATEVLSKRQFEFGPSVIAVLLVFFTESTVDDGLRKLEEDLGLQPEKMKPVIEELRHIGLLVDALQLDDVFVRQVTDRWSSFGWKEAADYHLSTFDFPFLDYADGVERLRDVGLMQQYSKEQPDNERTKRCESKRGSVPCPHPVEALGEFKSPLSDTWTQQLGPSTLKLSTISTLISSVFGVQRTRAVSGYSGEPLLLKTIPSGGARHPTEAYLIATGVKDLDNGIYHFNVSANSLDLISDVPASDKLRVALPGLFRANHHPDCFLILTSIFARNMYRYREPRTFRTIFMDVGHACSNVALAARTLGLNTFFHHGIDEEAVEKMLGLHPLREGCLYGIALKGREK